MTASPCRPIRTCRKSPRVRSPLWAPIKVNIEPRWMKCSLASTGVDQVGLELVKFRDCVTYNPQSPFTESGPLPLADVPYHATSTRPASPAAGHAKTFVNRPGVG